jgi:hypothetical protein
MITKDDKSYHRNVWSFTNRLKVLAATRDERQLAQSIEAYLKGEAEKCWNKELTNIERIGLVHDPTGVEECCNLLETRFKQPPSGALQTLHNLRYTTQGARNRKSPTAYVSELVAAAQACGQGTNEYALVLHAWTHLDIELRENIDEPAANTTIATFMEVLRRKQVNWLDQYRRQQRPPISTKRRSVQFRTAVFDHDEPPLTTSNGSNSFRQEQPSSFQGNHRNWSQYGNQLHERAERRANYRN